MTVTFPVGSGVEPGAVTIEPVAVEDLPAEAAVLDNLLAFTIAVVGPAAAGLRGAQYGDEPYVGDARIVVDLPLGILGAPPPDDPTVEWPVFFGASLWNAGPGGFGISPDPRPLANQLIDTTANTISADVMVVENIPLTISLADDLSVDAASTAAPVSWRLQFLEPTKTEFNVGDPVVVRVRITNTGRAEINDLDVHGDVRGGVLSPPAGNDQFAVPPNPPSCSSTTLMTSWSGIRKRC